MEMGSCSVDWDVGDAIWDVFAAKARIKKAWR
jgi:hypothetical protein